jgi:hypothetical protein
MAHHHHRRKPLHTTCQPHMISNGLWVDRGTRYWSAQVPQSLCRSFRASFRRRRGRRPRSWQQTCAQPFIVRVFTTCYRGGAAPRHGAAVRSSSPPCGSKANNRIDDIPSSNPDRNDASDDDDRTKGSRGAVVQRSGQTVLRGDGLLTNRERCRYQIQHLVPNSFCHFDAIFWCFLVATMHKIRGMTTCFASFFLSF